MVLALAMAATMVAVATWLGAPRTAALPSLASITLTPVADAYVSQAQPATNFNNAANWLVQRDSMLRERYPLLKFDLSAIPEGSEVSSAELGMYLGTATGQPVVELAVERITFTWNQATVTWNSRPPTQGRWATLDVGNSPGWRNFDVRVLTNNWVRGSLPNHGVVVRGPEDVEFLRAFASTGGNKPRLVVIYQPPTPTATTTATGTPSPTATGTPTPTATATPSATATGTPTPTATGTSTPTTTGSPTASATGMASASPSATSATGVAPSPTSTPTPTATPTVTPTPTGSTHMPPTATPTSTGSPSITPTPDYLGTATALAATLTAIAPTAGTPGLTDTPGTATGTPTLANGTATPSPTMGPVVALLFVPSAERP